MWDWWYRWLCTFMYCHVEQLSIIAISTGAGVFNAQPYHCMTRYSGPTWYFHHFSVTYSLISQFRFLENQISCIDFHESSGNSLIYRFSQVARKTAPIKRPYRCTRQKSGESSLQLSPTPTNFPRGNTHFSNSDHVVPRRSDRFISFPYNWFLNW